ncbi:cell division protein ZapB [Halopiger xanaduensis]|uniref:DUF7527 domain-containing protein n=1 Tax=Halopiger xanaduensis (strain DSM 18323 / JCM 14033 / SH-6) TaxID=797210 RepID=F8DBP8_HALXS|nr:cell division protein ZapB [Halopiger xanaduensis]AEH38315.1 hypothetical protein Halxa_3708 [Halopiger xanaduensis SH-6]
MDSRTQERVEQWDSRPFNGGYDGLSDLAESGFSGAVTTGTGGTWLFMLNGRIVGVFEGAIEDFDGASGTVYQAPHPSLPLLCSMEEQGGDTRAKYYTNETPLREVDETLQSGSFTGYIILSENVLSGDYYAVYYGGRRMAAAYIGNAERLVTGDEAFERADDEVGIYEVVDVDVEVTDVPGADDTPSAGTDADTETGATTDSDDGGSDDEPSVGGVSGVEPIDISGGSSAGSSVDTGSSTDDAVTGSDGPSGITATDPDATARESTTPGITDDDSISTDAAPDPDPDSADAAADSVAAVESEPEPESDPEPEPEPDPDPDGVELETGTDHEPGLEAEPDASTAAEADADSVEAGPDSEASPAGTSETESGTGTGSGSPDPAEVEAAAEQLDQNDISWTGDDEDEQPETTAGDVRPPSATERTGSGAADADSPAADADADGENQLEERFEEEEQWRETRRIPSIDPEKTTADGSTSAVSGSGAASGSQSASQSTRKEAGARTEAQRSTGSATQDSASGTRGSGQADGAAGSGTRTTAPSGATADRNQSERIERLSDRIERLEEQREALESKNKDLVAERDQLREKNQQLSETIDRLESRIEELESELEAARAGDGAGAGAGAGAAAGTELSPDRALAGTNLFVRYRSKSQPTLETAHGGDADRDEVASNLQLEHHTEFDASDVAVEGVPYEEFLTGTMAYRFVEWLTDTTLYEIRDTGHANGLSDLYDVIPQIDRAELDATISLEDDDTDDVPDEVTFDVVAFDKMGNPLLVAMLNDSRKPLSEDTLAGLEEAASAVKANYPDLAAAIAVTSSYFESGAHEVTEEATSSGFLSRSSKLSYVSLSRKQGYHLCLVESRSEGFHMTVPEL